MPDWDVEALAASLRTHTADLALYSGFLVNTVAGALPPEMVVVEHRKGLFRRGTAPVLAVSVQVGDRRFTLRRKSVGAVVRAQVAHVSHGIVLSTSDVGFDVWSRDLAAALTRYAAQHAEAAELLRRITLPDLP
ncbi:hypothetical protein [Nocardia sp. NRRL S-836]|uniref:hypothetical protein n=1 Tax=Nocardia sp. NRRL S-836 TaxID=1519492 RepID=UPI0006ADB351|nr:hypothetical protein [Nocardia sp. NRRL S-836]KOV85325.1 hypothetical protein ADL03_14365 [Nocardia sp. NRRL S-836]